MRVPSYNGQQVQERGIGNVRVPTEAPIEAFGGGASLERAGRAIGGVLDVGQKLAAEEFDRANTIRVLEEREFLNRKERELMDDPKTGALHRLGKNAFGAPEEVEKAMQEFRDEREKGLQNDAQRMRFRQMFGERLDSMKQRLNGHVGQQTKVYEEGVFVSNLESSKERGSIDPRNAGKEAAAIQEIVTARATSLGLSPEQTAQEVQKHESDLYARAINGMLTRNQDTAAEVFYEGVKDTIDPDVRTKLEAALEEGSLRRKGQAESDRILSKSNNLSAALAEAKQFEGKLRDEVERRVKEGFSLRRAAERDHEEQTFLRATNIVEKSKSFDAIPPNVVAALPLSARSSLRNYADSLRTGRKIETDLGTYYDLQTMASTPETRNKFLETPLLTYIDKLSATDFKHFAELQGGLRKGDASKEAELDGIQSDSQIVHGAMRRAGIDPTPKDTDKKAADKAYEVQRKIDLAVKAEAGRLGRKLRNEEISAIAEDQLVKGVTEEHWYGNTRKLRYQLERGETFKVDDIDEVPKSQRETIRQLFIKRRGVPPTDQEILRIYNGTPLPAATPKPAPKAAPRAPSAQAAPSKPGEFAEAASAIGGFASDFASTLKNSIKVPGGL